MKKLFSVFFMAMLAMGCFAQESYTLTISDWQWSDRPNSITIGAGAPSLVSTIESYLALDQVRDDRADLYSLGSYQLRYDYNVLRWLAAGARVSYDGWKCRSKNSSEYYSVEGHRLSVLMELLFTYINREHVTLYSGLALGMSQNWDKSVLTDGTDDARHRSFVAGGIIPIGVRVGGKVAYGMAEVSLGTESIIAIGFGCKF